MSANLLNSLPRKNDGVKRELIMIDYRVGVPQVEIAKKYGVSPAYVSRICKELEPTHLSTVDSLAKISTALSQEEPATIEAIEREVIKKVKDIEFFRYASLKIINKALERVDDPTINMYELEKAQSIIGKGRENIYGKAADTQVNVQNNQTNEVKIKWEE
ncbi:hypothetical protein UFOVP671_30 [uncultured Caudovirales phage]|uniref:HTH_XRE domain containing protein n=1 Tax=uncultured Caudovirales phage TaxID=2100421 RepID=A0A6J5NFZ4_9CAUD|nr:hypothetical protein UFOVP671_30 [uncultured Caudovirales phage]